MREEALKWWRNLSAKESIEYYNQWFDSPLNRGYLTFPMVNASSSIIEIIYREFYLKENI